ncbi:MAG: hypothetical protein ABEH43_05010, partial [Flavobacteriales bacterium]
MRLNLFFILLFLLLSYSLLSQKDDKKVEKYDKPNTSISFIENKGQWHDNALYKAKLKTGSVYLENNTLTYDLKDVEAFNDLLRYIHGGHEKPDKVDSSIDRHAFKVTFKNADPNPKVTPKNKITPYFNYFLGDDPNNWASRANGYKRIIYKNLYKNIDLKVRTKSQKSIKYDLIVHPKAQVSKIRMEYSGIDNLRTDKEGNLILPTNVGDIKEYKPYAYQKIKGEHKNIKCRFKIENNTISFEFPNGYNRNHKLIIDPTLMFSTYSGSYTDNFGYTATFDSKGFLYSGSTAFGDEYPVSTGAYQEHWAGGDGTGSIEGTDIALSKYDTSGKFMVFSTYLGGSRDEIPHSLIINNNKELVMYGTSGSPDYPVLNNAYDTTFEGGNRAFLLGLGVDYRLGTDIVISKISPDGTSLNGSTFIGGDENDGLNINYNTLKYNYADEIRGEVMIDNADNNYIASTTLSANFPTTSNAYQKNYNGEQDGVVLKMNSSLTQLIWSTYVGGSGDDALYSVAVDERGDLILAGGTESTDLNVPPNAIQSSYQGGRADGYLARMSGDGKTMKASSYWGSPEYDQIYFIELDHNDDPHVYGQTEVMDSTFIFNVDYATPNSGQFISKFSKGLTNSIWSTVFGSGDGKPNLSPTA